VCEYSQVGFRVEVSSTPSGWLTDYMLRVESGFASECGLGFCLEGCSVE
jgi:hypothetical protein